MGSKLGSASQLIYTAFVGGWQYFAFATMKENNQVKSNSLVFEYLGIISFVATAFICAWSYDVFKILFEEEYLSGYIIAPYLFCTASSNAISGGGQSVLGCKKTWPTMLILSSGAVLNIGINWLLIPLLGIEGAAIATLMGYVVSDIICVVVLCRMKLMVMSFRFGIASLVILIFMAVWRLLFSKMFFVGTIGALLLVSTMLYLYDPEIKQILSRVK